MTFSKYSRATRWWIQNKCITHQRANVAAESQYGSSNPEITYISAFSHDSNEILTGHVLEVGQDGDTSGNTVRRPGMSEIKDGGHKLGVETYRVSQLLYTLQQQNSNGCIPMFSGSGYTTRPLRRPPDAWTSCKLTMSFINRKLTTECHL